MMTGSPCCRPCYSYWIRLNKMEKTDLTKILSVSGEHGLFAYIAQGRNGIIAESLETGHRQQFGANAKVSALADISIYTDEAEV
ncbi:MAG: DUF5606 domain-containing protein, partial [Bacteroidales bacterium]|nr:DUF5606 domain-containing protein [Bacteroidales bacterium]